MTTITASQLADAIAATDGSMTRGKIKSAIEAIAGRCTENALTDILQWLDDEGLTEREPRRRFIPEWHGLDYVLETLREDYRGVEFPVKLKRKDGRNRSMSYVNPPKFVVIHDPDGLFNGFELSEYSMKLQFWGPDKVPVYSRWEMLYIPKKGEPIPCVADGLRIFRKDTWRVIEL